MNDYDDSALMYQAQYEEQEMQAYAGSLHTQHPQPAHATPTACTRTRIIGIGKNLFFKPKLNPNGDRKCP